MEAKFILHFKAGAVCLPQDFCKTEYTELKTKYQFQRQGESREKKNNANPGQH